ncbi:LacI family DNA-binding transcriptional regulator [Massilia cavernae]|uniref:LacI family transcriptional regulator n=1 Tax=Massilia cavernae TaxID=2320864 RepID=A0A418Y863_9BURK|nr:LacI family DNA-binding transcriptional regulator [Massilia cavernae]RJG27484.1 LacI family transcriptional regulator [Massilia cavernae]
MKKKKAVTLVDVAKKAGVSVMTASRALNEDESASKKAREMVRQAVQELGYAPNALARLMKGGRTNVIGVIVNDLSSVVVNAFATAVSDEVRKYDMDLFIYSSQSGLEHGKGQKASQLLHGLWDGLIYVLPRVSPDYLKQLETDADHPIVLLNYCRETSLPVVRADNQSSAHDAVSHLIELGHRRIAFIRGTAHTGQSPERELGYSSALEGAGLPLAPELIQEGDFNETSGLEAGRALLALPDPPTAIFAANDCMAIGSMTAVREKGLRIPEDVSIIGFDDIPMARAVQPGLTTLRQPIGAMAHAAVQELMRRIQGQPGRRQRIEFPSEFIIRESAGPVAGKRPRTRRAGA